MPSAQCNWWWKERNHEVEPFFLLFEIVCQVYHFALVLSFSIWFEIDAIANSVHIKRDLRYTLHTSMTIMFALGKKKEEEEEANMLRCHRRPPMKNCLFAECQWFWIVYPIGIQIHCMLHFPQESFCHWHLFDRCACVCECQCEGGGVCEYMFLLTRSWIDACQINFK